MTPSQRRLDYFLTFLFVAILGVILFRHVGRVEQTLLGAWLTFVGLRILYTHRLPFTGPTFRGTWIVTIGSFCVMIGAPLLVIAWL